MWIRNAIFFFFKKKLIIDQLKTSKNNNKRDDLCWTDFYGIKHTSHKLKDPNEYLVFDPFLNNFEKTVGSTLLELALKVTIINLNSRF